MTPLGGFDLDADITLSELREEDTLRKRLEAHHRLRVRRRSDVIGVLVDAHAWRAIESHLRELEQVIERYEEQAAHTIVADRAPNANFVPVTPVVIDDIERQYNDLTARDE
ncbi:MAG TPA: hypothetical protein VMF11_14565 [Candidatus Baltobacteraceae bacterium]|nr:hypothetical protein [Candidatus Baltobacteraceae bacterium]